MGELAVPGVDTSRIVHVLRIAWESGKSTFRPPPRLSALKPAP